MRQPTSAGGDAGFVRADQIDLKSLDEQLERHLSRAWTMEKRKEEASGGADQRGAGAGARQHSRRPRREDWEIDPAKLVVKGVIARGTFGTVHRGIYDAHDVAGSLLRRRHFVLCTPHALHTAAPARARLVAPESPRRTRTANAAPVGDRRRLACVRACPTRSPPFCCLFWQIAGIDALLFGGLPVLRVRPLDISWMDRAPFGHSCESGPSPSRDSCDHLGPKGRNAAIVGCRVALGIPQRQRTL